MISPDAVEVVTSILVTGLIARFGSYAAMSLKERSEARNTRREEVLARNRAAIEEYTESLRKKKAKAAPDPDSLLVEPNPDSVPSNEAAGIPEWGTPKPKPKPKPPSKMVVLTPDAIPTMDVDYDSVREKLEAARRKLLYAKRYMNLNDTELAQLHQQIEWLRGKQQALADQYVVQGERVKITDRDGSVAYLTADKATTAEKLVARYLDADSEPQYDVFDSTAATVQPEYVIDTCAIEIKATRDQHRNPLFMAEIRAKAIQRAHDEARKVGGEVVGTSLYGGSPFKVLSADGGIIRLGLTYKVRRPRDLKSQ